MNRSPSDMMIQVIGKLPLFKGLSPNQVHYMLSMAEHRILQPGQALCTAQKPASEIHILVGGELGRLANDSTVEERIAPICPIGAIELLTHKLYKDTFEALQTSHVLSVSGTLFEKMLDSDRDAQVKIYQNLAAILAGNMEYESDRQAEFQEQKSNYQARIHTLETQLKDMNDKMTEMMGLLIQDKDDAQLRSMSAQLNQTMDLLTQDGPERPPCVLVVDDQAEFRTFIRRVLSSCTVLEAESGSIALDTIRTNKVDLVISDIRMSEMDGCTLLTNLRHLYPDLTVLATSGALNREDLSAYDFNGFIDKPIEAAELRTIVANALQR